MRQLFFLIGRKLGHSQSAGLHNDAFRKAGIDALYVLRELDSIDRLPALLDTMPEARGFNVTIPYKEQVMDLLDTVSPLAKATGAVNTVAISHTDDGSRRLHGYNTDVAGFTEALRKHDSKLPQRRRALVFGTGGAAKAACTALRSIGIAPAMVSRKAENGDISYADMDAGIIAAHTLIVNATPLGMRPDTTSLPDIPYEALTAEHFCFDMVYNPAVTAFMKASAAHGAEVCNGLEMLRMQAQYARQIWLPSLCEPSM